MNNTKGLLLKSNRTLGSQLVDSNLIKISDLESANLSLMKKLRSTDIKEASLLKCLLFDLQVLNETKLIEYQIEELDLGYCFLPSYNLDQNTLLTIDVEDCWATWSIPFDFVSGYYFISSAYYLSPYVRKFWEEKLNGDIIWYVSDISNIGLMLEQLSEHMIDNKNKVSS